MAEIEKEKEEYAMKVYGNDTCRFFFFWFWVTGATTTSSVKKKSKWSVLKCKQKLRTGAITMQERACLSTAAASTRRAWQLLQPLCFFNLHKCNYGWLSSSAHCTSSGKVSLLSHRQRRQSAGSEEASRNVLKPNPTAEKYHTDFKQWRKEWMGPWFCRSLFETQNSEKQYKLYSHLLRGSKMAACKSCSPKWAREGREGGIKSSGCVCDLCERRVRPQTDCTESHTGSQPCFLFCLILCSWERRAADGPPHTWFHTLQLL